MEGKNYDDLVRIRKTLKMDGKSRKDFANLATKMVSSGKITTEQWKYLIASLNRKFEGSGILDTIKSIWNRIPGVRNQAPPQVRKFLEQHNGWMVRTIDVCRVPIFGIIQKLINVLRKLTLQKQNALYDKLFHLYMVVSIQSPDGKSMRNVRIERNQTFEISPVKISDLDPSDGECKKVSAPSNTDIVAFIGKAVKGPDFWRYHPISNNCQEMLIQVLRANNVLTPALETFIKQDVSDLLPKIFGDLGQAITDKAHGFDRIVSGNGKKGMCCDKLICDCKVGGHPPEEKKEKFDKKLDGEAVERKENISDVSNPAQTPLENFKEACECPEPQGPKPPYLDLDFD